MDGCPEMEKLFANRPDENPMRLRAVLRFPLGSPVHVALNAVPVGLFMLLGIIGIVFRGSLQPLLILWPVLGISLIVLYFAVKALRTAVVLDDVGVALVRSGRPEWQIPWREFRGWYVEEVEKVNKEEGRYVTRNLVLLTYSPGERRSIKPFGGPSFDRLLAELQRHGEEIRERPAGSATPRSSRAFVALCVVLLFIYAYHAKMAYTAIADPDSLRPQHDSFTVPAPRLP
jgi:hypothetical protein